MGNALFINWDQAHITAYMQKTACVNALLQALALIGVQYVISQWIWTSKISKNKADHRRTPLYFVLIPMCGTLWALQYNFETVRYVNIEDGAGIGIAFPILAIGGIFLNLLFCWSWTKAFPLEESQPKTEVVHGCEDTSLLTKTEHVQDTTRDNAVTEEKVDGMHQASDQLPTEVNPQTISDKALPTKKPRLDYINNIKIFLTVMVILHHAIKTNAAQYGVPAENITNWWAAIQHLIFEVNQAYFMGLFFFFSGYFVPRSFDKKGSYAFLFERFKRLGIPFAVTLLLIGPYMDQASLVAIFKWAFSKAGLGDPLPYFPAPDMMSPGVTWFLLQLLLFSVIYALVCGQGWSPKVECPSFVRFFVVALVLGIVGAVFSLFFPESLPSVADPLYVFFFWRMFLTYIVTFFGGACAQRNNWMDAIKEKSRITIYSLAVVALVPFCVNNEYDRRYLESVESGEILPYPTWWVQYGKNIFLFFLTPFVGVFLSLAVTVFFMDFLNKTYCCTPFFAKAMYTAYIIQIPIINISSWLWFLVQEAAGVDVTFAIQIPTNLMCPAFFFTFILSSLIIWPLAYGIRSIPGFSQVL